MPRYSDETVEFEQSSGFGEYRTTLNAAMGEELRFTLAVSCYPTPAVFDLPSDFNVLNQNEPGNDVTVFDLSLSVTDEAVYVFTGKNGNAGQLSTAFSLAVAPLAGTLLLSSQKQKINSSYLSNRNNHCRSID